MGAPTFPSVGVRRASGSSVASGEPVPPGSDTLRVRRRGDCPSPVGCEGLSSLPAVANLSRREPIATVTNDRSGEPANLYLDERLEGTPTHCEQGGLDVRWLWTAAWLWSRDPSLDLKAPTTTPGAQSGAPHRQQCACRHTSSV
jgi:hypothetical protein